MLRLQLNHRRLDEELQREVKQRWVDPQRIQLLKKRKLAIKDRLHQITRHEADATRVA
ncbi:MAG: DUF465 domain-containing protein [Geminicoccaceae bacterium]